MVSDEAVDAAAEAIHRHFLYGKQPDNPTPEDIEFGVMIMACSGCERDGLSDWPKGEAEVTHQARVALDAAMPHIRQELAAELQSRADYVMRGVTTEKNIPPFASGLRLAARLVEGQTNE